MGWGTSFNTNFYISRKTFTSKGHVKEDIEENRLYIESIFNKFRMLAAATPSNVVDPEWKDDVIGWLNYSISNMIEELEEHYFNNFVLKEYLRHLEDKEDVMLKSKQLELEL
jgi:hypothetical protein